MVLPQMSFLKALLDQRAVFAQRTQDNIKDVLEGRSAPSQGKGRSLKADMQSAFGYDVQASARKAYTSDDLYPARYEKMCRALPDLLRTYAAFLTNAADQLDASMEVAEFPTNLTTEGVTDAGGYEILK